MGSMRCLRHFAIIINGYANYNEASGATCIMASQYFPEGIASILSWLVEEFELASQYFPEGIASHLELVHVLCHNGE